MAPSTIASIRIICSAGAITAVNSTRTPTTFWSLFHKCRAPPTTGGLSVAPDDGEAKHRHRVRDDVEEDGGDRQRKCAVERILATAPQLFVASRASGRRSRFELRDALQQIAMLASE